MKEYVNKFTGEIKKRDFGTPIWCPQADFEHYEPGTSMTAPDQVESLKQIVARCMRGEALISSSKPSYYDESVSDDELGLLDGTADLADIPSLLNRPTGPDGANSDVAQSGSASAEGTTTSESKTQSQDSSESKE